LQGLVTAALQYPSHKLKFISFNLAQLTKLKKNLLLHNLDHEVYLISGGQETEWAAFEAVISASSSLDGLDIQNTKHVTQAVLRVAKGAPVPNFLGAECCDQNQCNDGKTGNYMSFSDCQQVCKSDKSCYGIEYGKLDRCTGPDKCACYLVYTNCTKQMDHAYLDIYLKTDQPNFAGMECCDDDWNCDQSEKHTRKVSLSECRGACDNHDHCIGVEYGTSRSQDSGKSRCSGTDQCDCYLVTGVCSVRKTHLGFNVYLQDTAYYPRSKQLVFGFYTQSSKDNAENVGQRDAMGADFFSSDMPTDKNSVVKWVAR